MEEFLEKFKTSLEKGDYEDWIEFEQKRLNILGIQHQFEIGETIDMIFEGIKKGKITFKPSVNFNAFMKMQIRSAISKHMKRLTNKFDGYKDQESLDIYKTKNGELTEEEYTYIEQNYDLAKLEHICFEKILADDEEASLTLMLLTDGKEVKKIATELNITEKQVNNALRRARYKLEKYLPKEFKDLRKQ